MTDDRERAQPEIAARPAGRGPTGMRSGVTLFLGVVLIGLLMFASTTPFLLDRAALLERPVATAERKFERDLALTAAAEELPAWKRALLAPMLGLGHDVRDEAIRAFESLITHQGFPRIGAKSDHTDSPPEIAKPDRDELDGLSARRAVLLAEAGRIEEAQGDLDTLTTHGHEDFVRALRVAYSGSSSKHALEPDALALAGDGWIGGLCARRAAQTAHDDLAFQRADERLRADSDDAVARTLRMSGAEAGLLLAGIAILLWWAARNRPDGPLTSAALPPPWTVDTGYGVFVRAAAWALVIWTGLELAVSATDVDVLKAWPILFMAIPLVILVQRHLLAPNDLAFGSAFGFKSLRGPLAWLAFTLGLFALDQLGGRAIDAGFALLGAAKPWSETVFDYETGMWSSAHVLTFDALDKIAWAPLFQEIAWRGVLYATLRRNHGPVHAALVSGAMFGAVRLDSLPGLASATWSGFVWALAYERCRSLVPSIACHALGNALTLGASIALYR